MLESSARVCLGRASLGLLFAGALGLGCYKPVSPKGHPSGGSAGANGPGGNGLSATGGVNGGTNGRSAGSTGRAANSTGSPGNSSGMLSTNGGSTSGSSCSDGAPENELASCRQGSDCGCPLECTATAQGKVCELPCDTLTDCPDLETTCLDGVCQPTLCGLGGHGPVNGQLDGTCSSVGKNDGSCIPATLAGADVGLCSQAGSAGEACDPGATRSQLDQACAAGAYCLSDGDGGGSCLTLCDPFGASSCGVGAECEAAVSSDPRLGLCFGLTSGGSTASSGSSGSTSGTSGTSGSTQVTNGSTAGRSSGTSSGTQGQTQGSTGGTGGSTGCGNPNASEFQSCESSKDCGCTMVCTTDRGGGGQVCEFPCDQTSDCPDLLTLCKSGICQINACGPGTGNGHFNSTCNALGTNDGTCVPLTLDGGSSSFGYCYQAGSATSNCDPDANRGDVNRACPPGSMCYGGSVGFGGTCNQLCNPNIGGPCSGEDFCSPIIDEPDLGICVDGNGF